MATFRAQVCLMPDTGLAADAATNTWYFGADTQLGETNMKAALNQFYVSVSPLLSSLIDDTTSEVKWYDMADPEPRDPVDTTPLTGLTLSSGSIPTEVALVLSFQAEKVSGLNQKRRRGRIFLGPLGDFAGDRPATPLVQLVRDAGSALLLESSNGGVGTTEFTWLQHSPTDGLYNEIDSGWVDNEFDTQRRRGRIATERITF